MPRHAFTSGKTQGGDATIVDANEWNAALVPIVSTCAAVNTGTAIPLTISNGANTLLVEKCEVTCDNDSDTDVATIASGSVGQVIDVVVVAAGATNTGFNITGSFSGGATTVVVPATGTALIGRGVRLIWSTTDSKWAIDCFYNEWPARGVEVWEPIATEPTGTTGVGQTYVKNIGGRYCLKVVGPSGLDTPLQPALWQNNVRIWNQAGATAAGTTFGLWTNATAGTASDGAPTTTSKYTWMHRTRFANVVTTTNQVLGNRSTVADIAIGSVAGQGGFFFYTRCGFDVWTNGGRFFAGFATATTVITADPSALNNTVGFAVDVADNGLINFLTRNGTTATKQSTGLTIATGKGYECTIFCPPNGTTIYYRIIDINTGTVYENSTSSTLPVNTTMLTPNVLASNGALATATAIQLGINKIYVETDY